MIFFLSRSRNNAERHPRPCCVISLLQSRGEAIYTWINISNTMLSLRAWVGQQKQSVLRDRPVWCYHCNMLYNVSFESAHEGHQIFPCEFYLKHIIKAKAVGNFDADYHIWFPIGEGLCFRMSHQDLLSLCQLYCLQFIFNFSNKMKLFVYNSLNLSSIAFTGTAQGIVKDKCIWRAQKCWCGWFSILQRWSHKILNEMPIKYFNFHP